MSGGQERMPVKRWAAAKRLKPGDGRELQGFRWWQLPVRALLWLRLSGTDGPARTYTLDVRHRARLDNSKIRAHLFLDGRHVAESKLPAVFPVQGGVIEVAMSLKPVTGRIRVGTGDAGSATATACSPAAFPPEPRPARSPTPA